MAIKGTQIYLGGQPINLILNNNFVDANPFDTTAPKVLDTYSGAVAGYSLRKLRNAYTGSAIEVTRTSDSATQNIGFDVDGNLDTGSLTSFIGANTGVVSKWYDQTSNSQDMSQSTQANMPTIVSSGTLITQGGKPAVRFDGTNDSFIAASNNPFTFTGPLSVVHASYKSATAYDLYETILSAGANGSAANNNAKIIALGFGNGGNVSPKPTIVTDIWTPSGIQYNGTVSTNARFLIGYYISNWSTHRSTGTSNVRLNGSDISMITYNSFNPTSLNVQPMRMGVLDTVLGTSFFEGDIQEVLVWASDENSNRTGIEGNMNDYYSVY